MEQREKIIQYWMGRQAHVVIDRPMGYVHHGLRYPINYGYLPGVMAPDGEEQDVYVLGVAEPLEAFDGRIIAAVRRRDDAEDKLVAAPEGMLFHQAQIAQAIHFQERFFDSTVDSLVRRSCGVMPFRLRKEEREYLLLKQTNRCWSFPKGHMEMGETEQQTALRELKEETGLTAALVPGVRAMAEYPLPGQRLKQVVLFAGEAVGQLQLQSSEITDHCWVRAEELKAYLQPEVYAACIRLIKGLDS